MSSTSSKSSTRSEVSSFPFLNYPPALVAASDRHFGLLPKWAERSAERFTPPQDRPLANAHSPGTELFEYAVADRTQVAEFDLNAWMAENPVEDEEESAAC